MDYMEYIRKIRSSSLSYKAKLVAIMIASHYNFKTSVPAFPSVDTLAEETGLSGRSVSRAKIELIENGWLVTHRQFNRASLSVPTCPGGELNTHINTHINIKDNQTSFDNNNQNIMTGEIFNISSETIANPPVEFKANAAAERIIKEDWLSW